MKHLKLTKEEKDYVKKIPILNDKRDYLQNLVIKRCLENTASKKYVWSCHPRMGKSFLVLKLIKLFDKKYTNPLQLHLIITPTTIIKEDFIKLFEEHGIKNVVVVTCSGIFTKHFQAMYANYQWGIVVGDESDVGQSSEKSIQWSKILDIKSKHFICMSGTFDQSNIDYLSKAGFDVLFDITIEDGGYMETLPQFSTYNYGIDLTLAEQAEYAQIHEHMEFLIAPYRRMFTVGNWAEYAISMIGGGKHYIKIDGVTKTSSQWLKMIADETGWQFGVLLGRKKRYIEHRGLLNNILEIAAGKIAAIDEIVNNTDERGIIFTSRKETCDLIEKNNNNIVAYHSSSNKDAINEFNKGFKKAIISVNKISRGFTNSGIGYAINSSYNSTSNGYVQKISRALSLDENNKNKTSKIINLYCKNFTINNKEIISRDYIRLIKAQKGATVEWVDNFIELND